MKIYRIWVIGLLLSIINVSVAQNSLKQSYNLSGEGWEIKLSENGTILDFYSGEGKNRTLMPFRKDKYSGPVFKNIPLECINSKELIFEGHKEAIIYRLQYISEGKKLKVKMDIINKGESFYQPKSEDIYLGIDTYMQSYPEWDHVFSPTLLRSEKTHFWAYFMTPKGKILTVTSSNPIASWNNEYETRSYTVKEKQINNVVKEETLQVGAHRIYTSSLSLLHQLPLPNRHPQQLTGIAPGKSIHVNLYFEEAKSLQEINRVAAINTKAPIIKFEDYTLSKEQTFKGKIVSTTAIKVKVIGPNNTVYHLKPEKEIITNTYSVNFIPNGGEGTYTVISTNKAGKISEAKLYVRKDWSWYLRQARSEALRVLPTYTHHAESFYPFYTYFLARKHLPDSIEDQQAEKVFQELFPKLYDSENKELRELKSRIQNSATMAGILADRYQVTGDERDLELAVNMVDFLIEKAQKEDGAYYNFGHGVHYTSVIYIAKSIMEVVTQERKLALKNELWKEKYNRHLESVQRAIDDLEHRGSNVQTEGQQTFEDGMISCSVTQLAMGALRESDANKRKKYIERAVELDKSHQCLTQMVIPDSRMNGATLRFWEAQYTVNMMHNMMNSPSGWSLWKTYGTWYLYLLTGETEYFKQTMNSLGTGAQLINIDTGKLRFCFVPDPYIETQQYLESPLGSGIAKRQNILIGEQYIDMISGWHKRPNPTWREKWGIDNFVHEVFKCIEEIALTNAYVVENKDGSFETYNCELQVADNGTLNITPTEQMVEHLHVNLRNTYNIKFNGKTPKYHTDVAGLRWVGSTPDLLEVFEKMK
ncbi:hypothetical protein [Flavivirga spongiicola]|uniref:Alpha-L-rhamnosidase six-hairpin glycosidase domain-containing protein n=1 Tax=Flavivirga spongiicola TaxID=421621 RepID=A0ABU7XVR8_9FLAO|nr:hypothetical protein [Flavivirga sp. MEBiC05379]MDO5979842.1 hypothetical protein [Flavivirga sp. MEBiC05379]